MKPLLKILIQETEQELLSEFSENLELTAQRFGRGDVDIEVIESLDIDMPIHIENLRGLVNDHFEQTQSERSQQILAEFDAWLPKFKLVKPKTSDVNQLLGHRHRSSAELRVQAM